VISPRLTNAANVLEVEMSSTTLEVELASPRPASPSSALEERSSGPSTGEPDPEVTLPSSEASSFVGTPHQQLSLAIRAPVPPPPPRRFRCAHVRCYFMVNADVTFGGYCCKQCFNWIGRKKPPQHGFKCQRIFADHEDASIGMAQAIPPDGMEHNAGAQLEEQYALEVPWHPSSSSSEQHHGMMRMALDVCGDWRPPPVPTQGLGTFTGAQWGASIPASARVGPPPPPPLRFSLPTQSSRPMAAYAEPVPDTRFGLPPQLSPPTQPWPPWSPPPSPLPSQRKWTKYVTEDGREWWWNDEDKIHFLADNPSPWKQFCDDTTDSRRYWWWNELTDLFFFE